MIIDFHTHAFPDGLAGKALSILTEKEKDNYIPVTDGTVSGLIRHMDKSGVDISVVQPVITKQTQTKTLNMWAKSICSDRIISFGGIFPHTDDYKRDIDFIISLGLKGLKLHPEYQDFSVDAPEMLKIYDYALSRGLILLFHAGEDPGYPGPYKSSPRQFLNIVDAMRGGVIVAAHLGGHAQWDDVEKYLVGKNIYLDTSMGLGIYPREQFLRIVKSHGAGRLLFASDSPWSDAGSEITILNGMPISDAEKVAILSGNAKRLLRL